MYKSVILLYNTGVVLIKPEQASGKNDNGWKRWVMSDAKQIQWNLW